MVVSSNNLLPVFGFQKTSLIDYPGQAASVIYLGGCNLRCRYCHNRDLVLMKGERQSLDLIVAWLKSNAVKHLVITGGEPGLYIDSPEFETFLYELSSLYINLKLDTNGTLFSVEKMMNTRTGGPVARVLRYVAIDYKAPESIWCDRMGASTEALSQFIANRDYILMVNHSRFVHNSFCFGEMRTTVHASLLTKDDIRAIASDLDNNHGWERTTPWYLQQYRQCEGFDPTLKDEPTYSNEELTDLACEVGAFVRGVPDELAAKAADALFERMKSKLGITKDKFYNLFLM